MIREQQLHEICIRRTPVLKTADLPDTFQWKPVLMISCTDTKLAAELLKLTLPTGAVFTGPAGNGRHTSAEALAGSLYNGGRNYAQVLFLHGEDLDFEDPADAADVLKHLASLTREGDMVLVLDRPELSRHNLLLQRRLLRLQDVLRQQNIRMFIILIAGSNEDLDPEVLSRFPIYHCACPDEETVRNWFNKILKEPVPIQISGMNADTLVERLTGLSWTQLQDFHNHLKRILVYKWYTFLRTTMKEAEAYKSGKIIFEYEDVLPILTSLSDLRPKSEVASAIVAPFPMQYAADSPQEKSVSSVSTQATATGEQSETTPGALSAEEVSALFDL